MMNIIITIIPIFTLIFIGWIARKKFLPHEFTESANRLVFYIAIPAMIFRAISKASLIGRFNFTVIILTLGAIIVVFFVAWGAGFLVHLRREQLASFIHSGFHGNLGYIGLAVSYYYLGNEGFVWASIIAGFIIILQNVLAVFILQLYSRDTGASIYRLFLKVIGNPVITAAIAGILFSLSGIKMPVIIGRSLDILSNMALPLALLIIGASLSFAQMRRFGTVIFSSAMKLIILPGLGLILYQFSGQTVSEYLPGLILLASPTATVTYVMAKEMSGDPDFAAAAISASTMMSALTFSFWLHITPYA